MCVGQERMGVTESFQMNRYHKNYVHDCNRECGKPPHVIDRFLTDAITFAIWIGFGYGAYKLFQWMLS
jgi:hypothetical protein